MVPHRACVCRLHLFLWAHPLTFGSSLPDILDPRQAVKFAKSIAVVIVHDRQVTWDSTARALFLAERGEGPCLSEGVCVYVPSASIRCAVGGIQGLVIGVHCKPDWKCPSLIGHGGGPESRRFLVKGECVDATIFRSEEALSSEDQCHS